MTEAHMNEPVTGRIVLKRKREKPILRRHPWIFSGAIEAVQGNAQSGDLVDVVDNNGRFLARGLYTPHSQIRVRLLTWQANQTIDTRFWQRRLAAAINGRRAMQLEPATNAYRLVFSEADNLPGLIVDKYDQFLVMQCLTAGMDKRKEHLAALLAEQLQPKGIIERSDADVRQKEGLQPHKGVLWGAEPPEQVTILENNLRFEVDLLAGHKTGFYLDQRMNRAVIGQSAYAAGKRVLNLFAYTGGFAVYTAVAGASQIINVDSSIPVLELAEKNVRQNAGERPQDEYIAADVFDLLRYYRETNEQFDLIILDPPKFAHSQQDLEKASRGYKDLNLLAMQMLKPGGMLATFSCSGLVSADLFQKIVFAAALDAGRPAQIWQWLQQSTDHPTALHFPESAYLKGLLCAIGEEM